MLLPSKVTTANEKLSTENVQQLFAIVSTAINLTTTHTVSIGYIENTMLSEIYQLLKTRIPKTIKEALDEKIANEVMALAETKLNWHLSPRCQRSTWQVGGNSANALVSCFYGPVHRALTYSEPLEVGYMATITVNDKAGTIKTELVTGLIGPAEIDGRIKNTTLIQFAEKRMYSQVL